MNFKRIILLLISLSAQVHGTTSSQVKAVYDAAATGDENRVREVLCWQANHGQKPLTITDQALSHAIMENDCRATRVLTLLYDDLARSFWSRHYLFFTVVASWVGFWAGVNNGQKIALRHRGE